MISLDDLNTRNFSAVWQSLQNIEPKQFDCGYCGKHVASKEGYYCAGPNGNFGYIYICPSCTGPILYLKRNDITFPQKAPGKDIPNLPDGLSKLYNEARASAGAGAFTAAVLICRKMLMNIGVTEGADVGGKNFVYYVEYLADKGFVPPNGRSWVDYIRQKGNEATHEIALMTKQDAEALIIFVEMLLRFIYEFPNMVPPITP